MIDQIICLVIPLPGRYSIKANCRSSKHYTACRKTLDCTMTLDDLACSFCGRDSNSVERLVAGPLVYICSNCIDVCNTFENGEASKSGNVVLDQFSYSSGKCSFCEKVSKAANSVIECQDLRICLECLGHCNYIIDEAKELQREAEQAVTATKYQVSWRCSSCGEQHEGQFSSCWKCGAVRA